MRSEQIKRTANEAELILVQRLVLRAMMPDSKESVQISSSSSSANAKAKKNQGGDHIGQARQERQMASHNPAKSERKTEV